MDEIFKQYGSAIITVLSIVAVISVISLVIGSDSSSMVYGAFKNLIDGFYTDASQAVQGSVTT